MNSYRHGSLYVVETPRDRDVILRELKAIDPRLFVERQVTLDQEAVWCVVVEIGGDHPPITILEFRDVFGKPIPELSSGIVERMRAMERDGALLAAKVIRDNQRRIESARADAREHWEDLGKEFEVRMSPTRSAALPRGQSLRMSRDKRRAKGEKL